METSIVAKAHFESIEPVIIKLITDAKHSIYIVMAWLTSGAVKRALLRAKQRQPQLVVEIVVDDNDVNELYFLDFEEHFKTAGIMIRPKVDARFLHRKFMVTDERITLIGSYNFTRKAKRNAENVAIIQSSSFSAVHLRVFKAMTDRSYRDENIQLLFDHLPFAQKLLSTYYPFSRSQYKQYRSKIINGYCYTHDNGFYDELTYNAGFIFNPKCWMDRKLDSEFNLPVSKKMIKNWIGSRNENLILEGYREMPELWDELGEQIGRNWDVIDVFYQAVFDTTYAYDELRSMVASDVDIIKEDRLYPDNFALFLNEQLVHELFKLFPDIENDYTGYELRKLLKIPKRKEPWLKC